MSLLSLFAFLIGASVGSFLNVCISRWPAGLSIIRPRSRCPRCERPITWYENIPIVSWVALRAKCRGCGLPISAQYPAVEAVVGGIWLASYLAFGPTLTMLRVAICATILLGVAVTDLLHYVIPDGFTVSGFIFALLMPLVALFIGEPSVFAGPWDAVLGACVGAGAITIVGWLGEVALKKEAMGEGDATLMAFVGAMLGPGRSLLTIFVAAALASVVFVGLVVPVGALRARARGETFELPLVPFGVFLAPAGVLTLLWGYPLIDWYLGVVTR